MAVMRGAVQHLLSKTSIWAGVCMKMRNVSDSTEAAKHSSWRASSALNFTTSNLPPVCVRVASGRDKLRVAVAVSGGVDSAVAALLLKDQGHNVVGVFMRNWDAEEEDGGEGGCRERDRRDAQAVCQALGIPLHEVDFVRQYWDKVFTPFLRQYQAGATPNPDLGCNNTIKFGELLHVAAGFGAEALATGHYARLQAVQKQGASQHEVQLLRASDCRQDQSYFLASVGPHVLHHCMFPVGHMRKADVRALAERAGLVPAHKRSSRGICFVGQRKSFGQFMGQYTLAVPGQCVAVGDGAAPPRILGPCEDLLPLTPGQRVQAPTSNTFATGGAATNPTHPPPGAASSASSAKVKAARAPTHPPPEAGVTPPVRVDASPSALPPINAAAAQDRVYVVGKDVVRRVVYVARGWTHPALFSSSALITAPTPGITELLSNAKAVSSSADSSSSNTEAAGVRFQYKVASRQEQLGMCTIVQLPDDQGRLQSGNSEHGVLDTVTDQSMVIQKEAPTAPTSMGGTPLTSKFHRMAPDWLHIANDASVSAQVPAVPTTAKLSEDAAAGSAASTQREQDNQDQGLERPNSTARAWIGRVTFDAPVRGLAPGQALVLYDQATGEAVVGAATILLPGPTLMEEQQGSSPANAFRAIMERAED